MASFPPPLPAALNPPSQDSEGKAYKKTVVVKAGKTDETEEVPLFHNKDDVIGEVSASVVVLVVSCG